MKKYITELLIRCLNKALIQGELKTFDNNSIAVFVEEFMSGQKYKEQYGLKFSDLEAMMFDKYLDNNHISMNTIYPEQRTEIAKKWLDNFRNTQNGK